MTGVRIGSALAAVGADGVADLDAATASAVARCRVQLAGRRPHLALVWVSGADPAESARVLAVAGAALGAAATIGCSAHGVVGSGHAVEAAAAVSVWAAVLPGADIRSFHLETLRGDASLTVVGMPVRRADDLVAVLFADPWSFPADAFVDRSAAALGGLVIVGGLASGAAQAGDSRLLVDGRVVDRGAVGVLLGGDIAVHALVSQGCRPVGPPMTVTAAEGNIIETLAGGRALDRAREVVAALPADEQVVALNGLSLGIAMDEYADDHERGDFLVRGVLGADEAEGAIAVGGVVEVGQTVRFHLRDAVGADDDLASVLEAFRSATPEPLAGALLVTCNGRGRAMFASPDHDVLAVQQGLAVADVGGFFAAGEFGPVGGRNHVHGFTATVLAFERSASR